LDLIANQVEPPHVHERHLSAHGARHLLAWLAFCAWFIVPRSLAGEPANVLVELNRRPFFLGREYFVLRSGRAQMIVQADRADLGPAFTCLLFDSQNARQSISKEGAFNYVKDHGFADSALQVVLGNFAFTALGHRTETHWVMADGIPAVEAVWWAGGVRVTERISALVEANVFRRTIRLEGAHLLGPESVRLRLALPPRVTPGGAEILLETVRGAQLGVAALDQTPQRLLPDADAIELGPITVAPNGTATVDTVLLVQIPAGDTQDFLQGAHKLVSTGAASEIARTRAAWRVSSSVAIADATIRELFDKARFGLPGMIADDGTMDAGMFEYGAQWVRDTANTALGAIHAGHFEGARHALERILTKMIRPDGVTMIAGGFDTPDREQFDQMGELLHVLKSYRDWTGDDSLVREHRSLLLALVERPLDPRFRDATGMVHNRREFWERTLDDAYELAYQTWVIQGLRDAADLAPALGAEDRVTRWRAEAGRMRDAVLHHPTRALMRDGRLIKRRNVTGEVADRLKDFAGYQGDVPLNTETHHRLLPDASEALPIALGVVDPRSAVARGTLDDLEALWNARWSDGGYDRYDTSSQPDQPGPWPFATCFILRAQHEAGLFDRSRRSLEWLNTVQGGRAGTWFEEIPSVRSLNQSCGLVCWTSAEVALFVVRHWLGIRFEGESLVLRPGLYPGSPPVSADLRFRQGRLRVEIDGSGPIRSARVNGRRGKPRGDGALWLPPDFGGGRIVIRAARGNGQRP
ncbi:MAG: hypothetical protein KGS61_13065, partial [Verrucomicrobia bacterium]|nr:hypothetical protein [Verrucomicrobiota bacterium]